MQEPRNIIHHRESLPFNKHIRNQVNFYLKGFLEENKGHCFTFTPVIFLNHSYNEKVFRFYSLFVELSKDEYRLVRVQRHEYFHYFKSNRIFTWFAISYYLSKKVVLFSDLMLILRESTIIDKIRPDYFRKYHIDDSTDHHIICKLLKDCQCISNLFYYCGPQFTLNEYIPSLSNLLYLLKVNLSLFLNYPFQKHSIY